MSRPLCLPLLYAIMAWTETTLPFLSSTVFIMSVIVSQLALFVVKVNQHSFKDFIHTNECRVVKLFYASHTLVTYCKILDI
jgi:hypothetical protein